MRGRLRHATLIVCLASFGWSGTGHATDASFPPPRTTSIESEVDLPPASLDETTLELFVAAVADLHTTATNLSRRLALLESRLTDLRTSNRSLEDENARLRKALRLQTAAPTRDWQSYPLDREVRDANTLLERLVSTLTGIAPTE